MLLVRPQLDMAANDAAFNGFHITQHHSAAAPVAAAAAATTAAVTAAAAAAAAAVVAGGNSVRRRSTVPAVNTEALHHHPNPHPHQHPHQQHHPQHQRRPHLHKPQPPTSQPLHLGQFTDNTNNNNSSTTVDDPIIPHVPRPLKRRRTNSSYLDDQDSTKSAPAAQRPRLQPQPPSQSPIQQQQHQQPQPQQSYGHFAPLAQDASQAPFVTYPQPQPPSMVDQSYFHLNGEIPQNTPHQPTPSLYHSESSMDSMTSTFPSYMHEPATLMHPHSGSGSAGPPEPWDPMLFDTGLQLKVQSLPVLDNCATKILEALSSPDWHDVLEAATQPDSGRGQAYSTQVALFDQIKMAYTRDQLFLNTQTLNLDPSANEIVRRTNLATFAATVFGQHNVPFSELHANCLDVFLANGAPLTKPVANLLLELKTQAYLAAFHGGAPDQQDLLEYFPSDIQAQLPRRRLETQQYTPNELDLINRVNVRRQQLIDEQYAPYSAPLYQTWPWQDFLQILCDCLRQTLHPNLSAPPSAATDYGQMLFVNGVHGASLSDAHHTPTQADAMPFPSYREQDVSLTRIRSLSHPSAVDRSPGLGGTLKDIGEIRAPIQQQYEKARASTSSTHNNGAKSAPPARRVSAASQRKPWSQDEEKALMDGLDQVKGPHWSQILALYGAGGRISEVLRERTQVQLKDKARNLKLFFLKSGIDVPAPLQGVTGELKTRAPAQAAKREREERLRAEREAAEKKELLGDEGASQSQSQQPSAPPPVMLSPERSLSN